MGPGESELRTIPWQAARRAGPDFRTWLAALVWCAVAASPALAQDPVPRDTVPGDTVQVGIPPEAVAGDTLPGDSLMPAPPDSTVPAPGLPEYGEPLPVGWAFSRWEWSRDELLRYRGLSLLDLLERLPGVHSIRSGGFGRPAGLAPAGAGGTSVRVFVDGFEMDPLGYPSNELQQIGLIDLESVRVERSPAGLRVDLSSFALQDSRAYSEVEASAGNYGTRMLRATLARAAGSRSAVTASYDLATTNGVALAEAFQARSATLRWAYEVAPHTGLQLELRQGGAEREGAAFPVDFTRRDLTFRARTQPLDRLVVEGVLGRSTWREERAEREPSPSVPDTVRPDVSRSQALLRAMWSSAPVDVEAAARLRSGRGGAPAAASELTLRGSVRPFPRLVAEGQVMVAGQDGASATSGRVGGRLGPFAGLSVFASLSAGGRWTTLSRDTAITFEVAREDTVDGVPQTVIEEFTRVEPVFSSVLSSAGGARVGAEWTGWGAVVGAAAVTLEGGSIVPFGVSFDRALGALEVGSARGVEGYVSLPVPGTDRALRLEGTASSWADTGGRPYLPNREARLGLEYHAVRIDGQFEPTLRVEAVHRGQTLVPTVDGTAYGYVTEPYTHLDLFLQLRVLDVRAYLIWENPTNNRLALDLPPGVGFQPGQRVVYGARWWFRN